MSAAIKRRLQALEVPPQDGDGKQLPDVVPDETTDRELDHLRRTGREVFRFSQFVEQCI